MPKPTSVFNTMSVLILTTAMIANSMDIDSINGMCLNELPKNEAKMNKPIDNNSCDVII